MFCMYSDHYDLPEIYLYRQVWRTKKSREPLTWIYPPPVCVHGRIPRKHWVICYTGGFIVSCLTRLLMVGVRSTACLTAPKTTFALCTRAKHQCNDSNGYYCGICDVPPRRWWQRLTPTDVSRCCSSESLGQQKHGSTSVQKTMLLCCKHGACGQQRQIEQRLLRGGIVNRTK